MDQGLFEPLLKEIKLSLDFKIPTDLEVIRYCLLILSNLSATADNHNEMMEVFLETLSKFSSHRDVKCREYTIFCIGNLCSNPLNITNIIKSKCLQTMITFAFPSHDLAGHIQFQAVAGKIINRCVCL